MLVFSVVRFVYMDIGITIYYWNSSAAVVGKRIFASFHVAKYDFRFLFPYVLICQTLIHFFVLLSEIPFNVK